MVSPLVRLALVFLGISCCIKVVIADADRNSGEKFGDIISTLDDIRPYYDENGKLSTHLLLYPESCRSIMYQFLFDPLLNGQPIDRFFRRKIHAVTGDAERAFFDTTKAGATMNCNAVCVERGVDHSLIQHPMPHLYYRYKNEDGTRTNEDKRIDMWYRDECERVEIGFINYYSKEKDLNIVWIDFNGNRVFDRILGYGEERQEIMNSYIGHRFLIEDPDTEEVLYEHLVEFSGIRTIGSYEIPEEVKKSKREIIQELVYHELHRHWDGHVKIKRTFSMNGFAKGRLPDDVFGSMGAYYYNNQQYIYNEEWNSAAQGIAVNWYETDAHFMNVPLGLKYIWQIRLLKLVEEWTNTKLEETAMYGIRQYEPGARLLTHVDRINTHAASLIVNVAQGNVTEPWAVEVNDHANRLHEVVMEPGDIVYYESAKMLHGRNKPLKGGYYANIFTHYRPVGDPQWYEKENPEGTPEPLLDIGECRLVGPRNVYSQGSVQCDDPRVGPHLSPSMFQAQNGDDLFNWWKHTSPAFQQQETLSSTQEGF